MGQPAPRPSPAAPIPSYSQLKPNTRCHPRFRNANWGDLGRTSSDAACQALCDKEPTCKFVSRYQRNNMCTSFSACTSTQSLADYSTWEKVTGGKPAPAPKPTPPMPAPPSPTPSRPPRPSNADQCFLPLGDSITHTWIGHTGWRYRLWKKLVDAGWNFDFVGTMTSSANKGWKGNSKPPSDDELQPDYKGQSFPRNHEGHDGWTVDGILRSINRWIPTYQCKPTCVTVHLGTNDIRLNQSVSSTMSELGQLIDVLKKSGADPTILLAVPIPSCKFKTQPQLLGEIPRLGDSSRKVHIVHMDKIGFDPRQDAFDGCHPNDSGEKKMAAKWFEAIAQHCVA